MKKIFPMQKNFIDNSKYSEKGEFYFSNYDNNAYYDKSNTYKEILANISTKNHNLKFFTIRKKVIVVNISSEKARSNTDNFVLIEVEITNKKTKKTWRLSFYDFLKKYIPYLNLEKINIEYMNKILFPKNGLYKEYACHYTNELIVPVIRNLSIHQKNKNDSYVQSVNHFVDTLQKMISENLKEKISVNHNSLTEDYMINILISFSSYLEFIHALKIHDKVTEEDFLAAFENYNNFTENMAEIFVVLWKNHKPRILTSHNSIELFLKILRAIRSENMFSSKKEILENLHYNVHSFLYQKYPRISHSNLSQTNKNIIRHIFEVKYATREKLFISLIPLINAIGIFSEKIWDMKSFSKEIIMPFGSEYDKLERIAFFLTIFFEHLQNNFISSTLSKKCHFENLKINTKKFLENCISYEIYFYYIKNHITENIWFSDEVYEKLKSYFISSNNLKEITDDLSVKFDAVNKEICEKMKKSKFLIEEIKGKCDLDISFEKIIAKRIQLLHYIDRETQINTRSIGNSSLHYIIFNKADFDYKYIFLANEEILEEFFFRHSSESLPQFCKEFLKLSLFDNFFKNFNVFCVNMDIYYRSSNLKEDEKLKIAKIFVNDFFKDLSKILIFFMKKKFLSKEEILTFILEEIKNCENFCSENSLTKIYYPLFRKGIITSFSFVMRKFDRDFTRLIYIVS